MTTGKTIALTRWTFVGKVMSLLFNVLSRLHHLNLTKPEFIFIGQRRKLKLGEVKKKLAQEAKALGSQHCVWFCHKRAFSALNSATALPFRKIPEIPLTLLLKSQASLVLVLILILWWEFHQDCCRLRIIGGKSLSSGMKIRADVSYWSF